MMDSILNIVKYKGEHGRYIMKQKMNHVLMDKDRIPFRSSANLMNSGINVFTGDKEVEFRGNYETDGFIFVRQTQPLPLTILSLYPKLQTNDG